MKDQRQLRRAITVCALGYFIDIFDIQLFAVLRVPSLRDLGVSADRLAEIGGHILNLQMFGMILGAFLWGYFGDRFGRLKALYGSIFLYSVGTLACSAVRDPEIYGVLRFVTGFGLAGETGVAITLISELMTPAKRGWGVIAISSFGFLGPVFAVLTSFYLPWRTTYVMAGLFGLTLLILRMQLREPELFLKIARQQQSSPFRLLLGKRQLFALLLCITAGLPMVFCWNVLNFFSLEFSRSVLISGEPFDQKICLIMFYFGTSCGDVICGSLSQVWQSRRKSMAAFLLLAGLFTETFLLLGPEHKISVSFLYTAYFLIGVGGGAWIIFCMIAAEHFGTNVRATTSSLVVNIVRGSNILLIFALEALRSVTTITTGAALLGAFVFPAGLVALFLLRETHAADLDYAETLSEEQAAPAL